MNGVSFGGIRYWARHDLGEAAASFAVFGKEGERKKWRKGRGQSLAHAKWIERIGRETGVRILVDPDDEDLDFTAAPPGLP